MSEMSSSRAARAESVVGSDSSLGMARAGTIGSVKLLRSKCLQKKSEHLTSKSEPWRSLSFSGGC